MQVEFTSIGVGGHAAAKPAGVLVLGVEPRGLVLLFVSQGQFKGTLRCKNPAVDPGYAACVVSHNSNIANSNLVTGMHITLITVTMPGI